MRTPLIIIILIIAVVLIAAGIWLLLANTEGATTIQNVLRNGQ